MGTVFIIVLYLSNPAISFEEAAGLISVTIFGLLIIVAYVSDFPKILPPSFQVDGNTPLKFFGFVIGCAIYILGVSMMISGESNNRGQIEATPISRTPR